MTAIEGAKIRWHIFLHMLTHWRHQYHCYLCAAGHETLGEELWLTWIIISWGWLEIAIIAQR